MQLSGRGGSTTNQERLAREIIEDVREEMIEAEVILPLDPSVKEVHKLFWEDPHTYNGPFAQVVAAFDKIEGSLDDIITLLRAQLQQTQRQHKLEAQDPEKAPEGYRDAVADYFERLSRDYMNAPQQPEEPKESAK